MSISQFTAQDYEIINRDWEDLLNLAKGRCRSEEEVETVRKAFEFANEAHKNIRRRSGEPYMIHPIAVAKIVVSEIGLGCKSISAALLHDVVEDTNYTVEDIRNLFGDKIASLVDGLTKIKTVLDNEDRSGKQYSQSLQAENFKRILLTLGDDVRVVLIKLADRLHNCRTIEFMPEHKRDKILAETMYVFIPLAHRLGLYSVKSEMENIWLRYNEPDAYRSISEKIRGEQNEKGAQLDTFIAPMSKALKDAGFEFEIKKRIKTPYSVWHKMQTKGVPFEEIYDLYAVRIIFDGHNDDADRERQDAYVIFAIITSLYKFQPGRTRDWIRQPKNNGYEALHCTLMSPMGVWIEVQIRSRRMDDIAEKGIAAHWAYKREGYASEKENEMDRWLLKVKEILDGNDLGSLELLDVIHKDLISNEIVVFTPKGDQRSIQNGATALDFAYLVHTEIGNRAIAAKVNLKLVPLSQVLKSGDQVEIITTNKPNARAEWLEFLQTRHARERLMEWIRENAPEELGTADKIIEQKAQQSVTEHERVVIGKDGKFIIASCCHPIPGDPLVGFRGEDGTITIHKKSCPVAENIASKFGDKAVVVPQWFGEQEKDFPVRISIKGLDRMGLLNEITAQISTNLGMNMRRLDISADGGVMEGYIDLLVNDHASLDEIINRVKNIEGVLNVSRTEI